MDVLGTAQLLLREAKFETRLRYLEGVQVVCFEDDSLLGFCTLFTTAHELLDGWQARELKILQQFAGNFRGAGDKAWNVYCAFLTADRGGPDEVRQIRWIEEDLERTRKIAACGLNAREDITKALLPVLPIQYQPQLHAEDATRRLQNRIELIAPGAASLILDEVVPPQEAARAIGRAS